MRLIESMHHQLLIQKYSLNCTRSHDALLLRDRGDNMQGSIAMLKDIQAAVADHATMQQHLSKKEWLPAVPVLLRLANKCARGRLLAAAVLPIPARFIRLRKL